jgi:hypothetical protein
MPIPRAATYQCTADPFEAATLVGRGSDIRQPTSRYSSTRNPTVGSARSDVPALTQANLQKQARLLEEQKRREYAEWKREESQRTLKSSKLPSQQQSQPPTHRTSQRSTSKLYAPLTSVLPPQPTAEDLLSRGFSYAWSTKNPDQDFYRKYTTATRGSKHVEVYDTVGIPSTRKRESGQ